MTQLSTAMHTMPTTARKPKSCIVRQATNTQRSLWVVRQFTCPRPSDSAVACSVLRVMAVHRLSPRDSAAINSTQQAMTVRMPDVIRLSCHEQTGCSVSKPHKPSCMNGSSLDDSTALRATSLRRGSRFDLKDSEAGSGKQQHTHTLSPPACESSEPAVCATMVGGEIGRIIQRHVCIVHEPSTNELGG